jgi:hypothetical protein
VCLLTKRRNIDWQVEVISDNTLLEKDCSEQLESMLRKSINAKTPQKVDDLGLDYIAVHPTAPPSYQIKYIIVRSTYQYKFTMSGYIVEIAIYRKWEGHSTQGTPKLEAGVILYHPAWESALEDISRLPAGRHWISDAKLTPFYDNGIGAENCGIGAFREAVGTIRDLLSSVQRSM